MLLVKSASYIFKSHSEHMCWWLWNLDWSYRRNGLKIRLQLKINAIKRPQHFFIGGWLWSSFVPFFQRSKNLQLIAWWRAPKIRVLNLNNFCFFTACTIPESSCYELFALIWLYFRMLLRTVAKIHPRFFITNRASLKRFLYSTRNLKGKNPNFRKKYIIMRLEKNDVLTLFLRGFLAFPWTMKCFTSSFMCVRFKFPHLIFQNFNSETELC